MRTAALCSTRMGWTRTTQGLSLIGGAFGTVMSIRNRDEDCASSCLPPTLRNLLGPILHAVKPVTASCAGATEHRLGDGQVDHRFGGGQVDLRKLVHFWGGDAEFAQHFDVGKKLGKGGFASVYQATERHSGLERTVKRIQNQSPSAEAWEELKGEVRSLQAMDHPNIVRLYGWFQLNWELILVEEVLAGGTLEKFIDESVKARKRRKRVDPGVGSALQVAEAAPWRKGDLALVDGKIGKLMDDPDSDKDVKLAWVDRSGFSNYISSDELERVQEEEDEEEQDRGMTGGLDTALAARCLRHMLRAVMCCHAHGIVHRDLKPDNFVFEDQTNEASLKLIDFGLSHAFKRNEHEVSLLSQENSLGRTIDAFAGTLPYTAPEAFKHHGYGAPADVWALGAILYLMLTGELLIGGRPNSGNVSPSVGLHLRNEAMERACSAEFISERVRDARENIKQRATDDAAADGSPTDVVDDVAWALMGCDLVEAMLTQDPKKRCSIANALKHPFIAQSYSRSPRGGVSSADDFDRDIVAKLRRFHAAPALARLGSLALAHMLGAHEAGLQHHTFRSIDATDNGAITVPELACALARWGCEVPQRDELAELFRKADMNRGGDLSLVEFVSATMDGGVYQSAQLCRAAFRILDCNNDGYIDTADIEAFFDRDGQDLDADMKASYAKAAESIMEAPTSAYGSDRINADQFAELMRKLAK